MSLRGRTRLGPSLRLWCRVALALGTISCALPAASAETRVSTDGTCPWGRLADGRGRLVRCLTREEAAKLHEATPAPAAPAAPLSEPVRPAPGPGAPEPKAAVAPRPPAAEAPPPGLAPAPGPVPGSAPPAPPLVPAQLLSAEIESVVADQGALEDAGKSLRKANDRLAECVERNGGLSAERGEIELRALVQARGRAEGVSLKSKRGVTETAAKCVADVIDRRFIGFPEEPAVGVTLVVTVTKKKK